jgi:uncharacterized membrane protein YgdD (TMEM256/DUF423 family)
MAYWSKALLSSAGLLGAAGVALSAYAAHADGAASLTTAATFLLLHAAAIAGLSAGGTTRRGLLQAATLLVIGVVLFSGDITLRVTTGASPWRMAAPTGGMMLIAGWLWLSVAALVGGRSAPQACCNTGIDPSKKSSE